MKTVTKLNLVPQREEVELSTETETTKYTIYEMTQAARDIYLEQVGERVERDAAGNVVGLRSQQGLRAALLNACMVDEAGKPVSVEKVQSWPAGTVDALHSIAKRINGLDNNEASDASKND